MTDGCIGQKRENSFLKQKSNVFKSGGVSLSVEMALATLKLATQWERGRIKTEDCCGNEQK